MVVDIPAAFQLKPPPKLLGRVVSALTRGDRRWRVGDVKTKYSESRLPLDSALAETLFNWKPKSLFGKDSDWLLASAHKAGELPLRSERMLAKQIKPAAAAAQIGTEIGWHTFRHTYSSMLRQIGVDVKVQQELLRHGDAGATLNLYTQAIGEQKRSAHSTVVPSLPTIQAEVLTRRDKA